MFCIVTGKRCEYLTSLSFLHNTSYVEVEPLNVRPDANVTITFATEQENGVLLYTGTVKTRFWNICSDDRNFYYINKLDFGIVKTQFWNTF